MTSIKSVQMEGEKFPLLGVKKRQSSVSPSPLQSWKDIVAEIRGPQRIWLLTLVTFIASLTTLLAGYTLGYPSSALLELSELPDEYAFTNETILPDLFGVSFKETYFFKFMCCFFSAVICSIRCFIWKFYSRMDCRWIRS